MKSNQRKTSTDCSQHGLCEMTVGSFEDAMTGRTEPTLTITSPTRRDTHARSSSARSSGGESNTAIRVVLRAAQFAEAHPGATEERSARIEQVAPCIASALRIQDELSLGACKPDVHNAEIGLPEAYGARSDIAQLVMLGLMNPLPEDAQSVRLISSARPRE